MNRSTGYFVVLTFGIVWLVVASGCGGGGGGGTASPVGSTTGTVTDNPRAIIPWSQMEGKTDVAATMRVNDSGTTVTEIPAEIFSATIQTVNLSGRIESGVEDLESQPGNNRGVFEGDSGSPVLVGGKLAGGLFGSSDGVKFGARGIQQEIATAGGPAKKQTQRIKPQWYFEGPASVMPLIRSHPSFANARYNGPVTQPRPGLLGGSVPPLPGRRLASPLVLGPDVIGYDAATYTYELSNGTWVGTAHGLEDAGAVTWPITAFSVDGFANGAVKGHIIGSVYGTLTFDGQNGSLINPNTPAPMMRDEVDVSYKGSAFALVVHTVRFDHGSDNENQAIELIAQAVIDVNLQNKAATFNATGSVSLTAGGTTTLHQLTFPNGMSLKAFEDSIGAQLQTILAAQHSSAPGSQIQQVVVRVNAS